MVEVGVNVAVSISSSMLSIGAIMVAVISSKAMNIDCGSPMGCFNLNENMLFSK